MSWLGKKMELGIGEGFLALSACLQHGRIQKRYVFLKKYRTSFAVKKAEDQPRVMVNIIDMNCIVL